MKNIGLVSISFRNRTAEEIIEAVKNAGLNAIEWGGDVHVPHGNVSRAEEIRALCENAGIFIPEYGSYYFIRESDPTLWEDVRNSARALGAPLIRVWGGKKSSDSLTTAEYDALVADAQRICDAAPDRTICLECHGSSITDEYHMTLQFLHDVSRQNLKMFWQPNQFRCFSYNIDALEALLPHICSVHVFSWEREKHFPLAQGRNEWAEYIKRLSTRGDIHYMLEFMHDGRIESLNETAKELKEWLK